MSNLVLGFGLMVFFAFGAWPLENACERVLSRPLRKKAPTPVAPADLQVAPPSTGEARLSAGTVMPTAPPRATIERLSPTQGRRLTDWLAEWSRLDASGATADRRDIEDAIERLYRVAGEPRLRFQWVDSPYAALAVAGCHREEPKDGGGAAREEPFPHTVRSEVYFQLLSGMAPQLATQIRDALRGVGGLQDDFLVLMNSLPDPFDRLATRGDRGQSFPDDLRFLACCRDVLGLGYTEVFSLRLDLWMRAARCHGWWWREESVCILSERPTATHRDGQGRLHHPSMPAIRFRDGFSVYAWHGVRVPEPWIMSPQTLRPFEALTWRNPEQRRAALEIVGWKRVIEDLGSRTIDCDPSPATGQLVEADLPGVGPARFLRVRCGTGREFVLAVPPHVRTALEANAWTYDLSSTQYQLEVRT